MKAKAAGPVLVRGLIKLLVFFVCALVWPLASPMEVHARSGQVAQRCATTEFARQCPTICRSACLERSFQRKHRGLCLDLDVAAGVKSDAPDCAREAQEFSFSRCMRAIPQMRDLDRLENIRISGAVRAAAERFYATFPRCTPSLDVLLQAFSCVDLELKAIAEEVEAVLPESGRGVPASACNDAKLDAAALDDLLNDRLVPLIRRLEQTSACRDTVQRWANNQSLEQKDATFPTATIVREMRSTTETMRADEWKAQQSAKQLQLRLSQAIGKVVEGRVLLACRPVRKD